MLALLEAQKAGLLQKQHWLNNIISGVIVGIVALPLAMAFAIASGAKPEQGLYTAIIAGFFVSVFGGSRLLTFPSTPQRLFPRNGPDKGWPQRWGHTVRRHRIAADMQARESR